VGARSFNELELRMPAPVDGPQGSVTRMDANALAPSVDTGLVYIDPPYNQHSYFSNYHVWETIVRWDAPQTYGIACKRVDCAMSSRLTTRSAPQARRSTSSWTGLARDG
jgi:adenine-specific DNA-methyltransferase